ncbi:hypothetical protein P3X46_003901 [Hevea brasiliensis]|uniref:F-box domain-containing protein n=1 Tax=Hevea brasiliensis TaxID=3981 RepID=A0ABQ9N7P6_HEVBR|nr:F-box/LRR-repeat protein At3g58900 [Hevea brasiliensis]KAJ9188551.1 hypothetical protein P3X46_003901 [Hevea brasiliensis]
METKYLGIHPAKKHKASKQSGGAVDRISNLPDAILHLILSFLQTVDAVKTSLLSKRWRYLWTSLGYLEFDHCYFWSRHIRFWYQREFSEKFTNFVTCVLSFRDGSDIKRFRLSSFNFCNKWVDKWIHVVISHNVRELDLSLCPEGAFLLPHSIGSSKYLTALKLNLFNHVLEIPKIMVFNKLTSLHLVSLRFLNDGLARLLFLGCPLLENLVLERCVYDNIKVLDIYATKLKTLTIENLKLDDAGDDGLRRTALKIFAPNLLSFKYMGPVARDYILQDPLCIVNVDIHLVNAFEKGSLKGLGYLMCKFIGGFYNVEVMKLSMIFLELLCSALSELVCFPAPFCNLKLLKLNAGTDKLHLQVIIHLLKSSPNLKAVHIYFMTSDWKDNWQPEDEAVTCLAYHLKTVEISNFEGQDNGLEFIKFVLENGMVLERITIAWSMNLKKPLEIILKAMTIMTFPRASSTVAIIFLEPEPIGNSFV